MKRTSRLWLAVALAAAALEPAAAGDFRLGVQTHFSQGWPEDLLDLAGQAQAQGLRDSVPWSAAERRPGDYDFSSLDFDALRSACDAGQDLVLTLVPSNKLYDAGNFVYTDEGRKAFAAYINALLDEFGACIAAIEVGNEINAAKAFDGPAAKDKFGAYAALLRTIRQELKPDRKVAILGGSTNVVGIGFLQALFAQGMLADVDGIAVHPYRSVPEGLDFELDRLEASMEAAGQARPVWATEFSDDFKRPADAAPFLIKMIAIMSAAGVERAYWYALIDQQWYPAMGLFDAGRQPKPAAAAYIAAQTLLLRSGRAVRLSTDDPLVRLYRFGNGRYVMWGAPRSISLTAGTAWDSSGAPLSAISSIGDDPVILSPDAQWTLGSSVVLADTRYQYGTAPFAFAAETKDGRASPLEVMDWEWTSYWGTQWTAPLRVNVDSLAVAGDAANPVRVRIRYTPKSGAAYRVQICAEKAEKGDGMDVEIRAGGKTLRTSHLTSALAWIENLQPHGPADIVFGPHKTSGGDATRYRIRILTSGGEAPPCS